MKKIIFVNSHPIQYFAPMYKYMNKMGTETVAWYCSDDSIKGGFDKEFGVNVKWDIPLLEGYEYRLFKNYSIKPSIFKGFFGLMNFGLIFQLFREPKSLIVVHGWNYFTHFFVLMLAKIAGHAVGIRNDMPHNQEAFKKGWTQHVKKIGLKYILFPRINYFMYIGSQNKKFYENYGIKNDRLVSTPYAVDNERFKKEYEDLVPKADSIRAKLNISISDKVIVNSGKYISKKRPLDLLKAFDNLNQVNSWLIMVGEGELRTDMENMIERDKIKNVILTGFVNQSKIAEFYTIADLFVMCSSLGENWGLSVNEAMNFNLPLVLSDLTGCSDDLVKNGENGYVFETGNVEDLTNCIKKVLISKSLTNSTQSKELVNEFSFDVVLQNLKSIIIENN